MLLYNEAKIKEWFQATYRNKVITSIEVIQGETGIRGYKIKYIHSERPQLSRPG